MVREPAAVCLCDLRARRGFFRVVCEHDLEGIVAKPSMGRIQRRGADKLAKIKNPNYSEMAGGKRCSPRPIRGGDVASARRCSSCCLHH